jgi:hypothetical protein
MGGHTKIDAILFTAMPIIYDMQGYPHFVVDFVERKPDGARKTVQAAMLLVRSFFDEGEQRMTSIDDIDIGTPANGWTIRFTGVTGAQPPEAYIATYRNGEISYNEDPNRQAASMSERVWYAVDFAKGKGGSKGSGKTKNCTKGKLCGGSCIAKGRNCRIETNPAQKKAADALSKTSADDAAKAKAAVKKEARKSGGSSVEDRIASTYGVTPSLVRNRVAQQEAKQRIETAQSELKKLAPLESQIKERQKQVEDDRAAAAELKKDNYRAPMASDSELRSLAKQANMSVDEVKAIRDAARNDPRHQELRKRQADRLDRSVAEGERYISSTNQYVSEQRGRYQDQIKQAERDLSRLEREAQSESSNLPSGAKVKAFNALMDTFGNDLARVEEKGYAERIPSVLQGAGDS